MVNDWAAFNQPNAGAGDQIIYYRRPRSGEDAGWIVYGDSLSGTKLRDYVKRGFEPLMKYGVINSAGRDTRTFGDKSHPADTTMTTARYIWEAILNHPDGPAEFPVDQIIAFRWHRPDNCPVPDAYFPQLVGKRLREYQCPERCGRAPFVEVDGSGGIAILRQHLRIMHRWDQANLQAYGERVGIDFNRADVQEFGVAEMAYGSAEEVLTCERCGQEFRGKLAPAHLGRHQKSHPVAEITVV